MVLLQISENAVGEPKNFNWGKGWRAVRIWKELTDHGEKFFALVIKKYGPGDYGTKKSEEMYIGREIKYLGPRELDTDPNSPTFSKRVNKDIEYVKSEVWDDKKNAYVEQQVPINANKTYKYVHDASDKEIITGYKTLVGDLPGGRRTQLIFLYDSRPVTIRDQKEFFETSVSAFREIEEPQVHASKELANSKK